VTFTAWGIHDLWLFVVSGFLLNVTPGPDTLYIVGRSTLQGRRAGIVAALGIGAGTLVHILAASLGLSAILAASATAFAVVKWVGAAYLVYVGISLILASRRQPAAMPIAAVQPAAMRSVFVQGFFTNVLNPKVALFFLAFLPQFVLTTAASKPVALLILGIVFDVNGTLWNLAVAWTAASFGSRVAGRAAFRSWFNRCVGSLFVCVGIKLALSGGR
jgi:threonine/homoserine/homoserine lactone efflux protein